MNERQRVIAEVLLTRRLRNLVRVDDDTYIDPTYLVHVEYQLFLDEMRAAGNYYQPDHWPGYTFPKGQGRLPVVGVRPSDAITFCDWLTQREPTAPLGDWRYRLPNAGELSSYNLLRIKLSGRVCGHWVQQGAAILLERVGESPTLSNNMVVTRHESDRALALALDLARDRDLAFVSDRDEVLRLLRWYARILALAITSTVQHALDGQQESRRLWQWQRKPDKSLQSLLNDYLDLYVDLVILEERIEGNLPAFEGIRIVREQVKEE